MDCLRDYQKEAVNAARYAVMNCGIIKAPTGSGKTRIAAGIIASIGGRWLLASPNKGLCIQTKRAIDELELPNRGGFSIEMASFEGLDKVGGKFNGFLADECHRIAATGWSEKATLIDARYRIGLSATPLKRSDDNNAIVVGLLGPVVYEVDLQHLQQHNHLASGKIIRVAFDHSKKG